jgi:leucyl aminopeptidase (aminopeptidase T)
METPQLKKCSCTRAPQPLDQFLDKNNKEVATCLKCRTKAKKYDQKPERREYHNELQKEKEYYKEWRVKQLEERPDEYRKHNNEISKEWHFKNPNYTAEWNRTHVNARLNAVKSASETRGIQWNLTDDEAKAMLVSPCIYCNHIDLEVRVNGIDRLDSDKSYTTENCRPCCKNCNYMKGTFDPKTFIAWAKKIAQCDAEFPDVPNCGEHKKINRKKPTTTPS